jgi:hypothetical protein
MTSNDAYRAFCAEAPRDFPLFFQDWYLDAVCAGHGRWQGMVLKKNDRVVAVWPLLLKTKWRQTYVVMPPLARFLGPYIVPEYRQPRHESSILETLLDRLPHIAAFEQDCSYLLTNWLPFYWRGFRQTTRYSYTLQLKPTPEGVGEKTTPEGVGEKRMPEGVGGKTMPEGVGAEARLWQSLAADYRNNKIPKAGARVEIRRGIGLEAFYRVHNRSFERQGLQPPVPWPLLRRLDAALAARGRREIFGAVDRENGRLHSVAYLAWDDRSAYYLMAGDEPALRSSGAAILLAWETIRYTATELRLEIFDFAGSMVRSIERVRRQFGAVQTPYFRLQKEWNFWVRWARRVR